MSTPVDTLVSRVRQPEYTGENRCIPCTVVNVAIALGASAVIGIVSFPAGLVAFGISLAAIYLRGYLVPGTPQLTKQYLPDRILRRFGKAPRRSSATFIGGTDESDEIDAESILREGGVLELTPDQSDLRLTDEFVAEWNERIEAVRESDYTSDLTRLLDSDETVSPDAIEVRIEEWATTAFLQDTPVAQWTSESAFIADLATEPLLSERVPQWDTLDLGPRGQLLSSVRLFLERCPKCDGELVLSEDRFESCCSSSEVVRLMCLECYSSILEVEV